MTTEEFEALGDAIQTMVYFLYEDDPTFESKTLSEQMDLVDQGLSTQELCDLGESAYTKVMADPLLRADRYWPLIKGILNPPSQL